MLYSIADIDGGSATRFTPPICPGPPRSCCSNSWPRCGVPSAMQFDPMVAFGKNVTAAMTAGRHQWTPSPLMAVHAWWIHPVWYNLIFGVGEVHYDGAADPPTLRLSFNRGGHQSSQGAASLGNWWASQLPFVTFSALHKHTHTHTHVHTYTHIHIYTYIHIYAHSHP